MVESRMNLHRPSQLIFYLKHRNLPRICLCLMLLLLLSKHPSTTQYLMFSD
ncbi:unnamed protein product [Brassica oleracea]